MGVVERLGCGSILLRQRALCDQGDRHADKDSVRENRARDHPGIIWIVGGAHLAEGRLQALKRFGAPVYVRHEIVHNRHVVEDAERTELRAFLTSVVSAGIATLLCLLLGYPLALGLTRVSKSWRTILLMFVILPFWTSFLLRVYAWMGLMGRSSWFNGLLTDIWNRIVPAGWAVRYNGALFEVDPSPDAVLGSNGAGPRFRDAPSESLRGRAGWPHRRRTPCAARPSTSRQASRRTARAPTDHQSEEQRRGAPSGH